VVKDKRGLIALVPLVALAVWLLFFRDPGAPAAGPTAPVATETRPAGPSVPWINLDRLRGSRPTVKLGNRNLFHYGVRTPPPTAPPTAMPVYTPMPTQPPTPMPTPVPPPMLIKFTGVVKSKAGPKIAVLMTEQKEILYGREGEVVGGRYRIANIGIESIRVQDVTTGQESTIRIGGR
jgi:hypothetical protein